MQPIRTVLGLGLSPPALGVGRAVGWEQAEGWESPSACRWVGEGYNVWVPPRQMAPMAC